MATSRRAPLKESVPTTATWPAPLALLGSFVQAALAFPASGAITFAAATSFYAILAIFPFLLLVALVTSRFLEDPALATQAVNVVSTTIPVGGDVLLANLQTLQAMSGQIGIASALGLLWSSMGLFSALRKAFDALASQRFDPPTGVLHIQLASLLAVAMASTGLLLLVLGTAMLGVIAHLGTVQMLLDVAPVLAHLRGLLLSSAILSTFLGIMAILCLLPARKPPWRQVVVPAVVAVGVIEILKGLVAWFFATHTDMTRLQGPLGAAIALMMWAWLTSLVVLFSHLWTVELGRHLLRARRRRHV